VGAGYGDEPAGPEHSDNISCRLANGDSGDGDYKNHGARLMEVLGADRSEDGAASGSLRDRLAEI